MRSSRRAVRASAQFWVLAGLLLFAFLTGGGARADIQSLVVLRPLAIVAGAYGVWTLRREHLIGQAWIFSLAFAILALVAMHLVPLAPTVWRGLAGREIVTTIDGMSGIGDVWRPLSLVPAGTINAFYALLVPLAVVILAVQLTPAEHGRLLWLILGFGTLSALLGVLQVIGDRDSSLYLYRITNRGSAVGLFANRNHAAMLLAALFPVLAIFASLPSQVPERARLRTMLALALGLLIIPLILVTGSRGGFIAAVIGLVSVPLLYHRQKTAARAPSISWQNPTYLVAAFGAIALGALTIWLARAEAFNRLFGSGGADEDRLGLWGPVKAMADQYAPLGSGIGSFEPVYQLWEPLGELRTTYANHAHNDYLETYLTGGWPALILIGVCIIAWASASLLAWRIRRGENSAEVDLARLGSIVFAIMAVASTADYPLRVPSLACLAALAAVWLGMPSKLLRRDALRG